MDLIYSLLKTLLYFGLMVCIYFIIRIKSYENIKIKWGNRICNEKKNNIGILKASLCAMLFGFYAVFITATPLTGDRTNYARSFEIDRSLTFAMNVVFDILRVFTDNPKVLFFTFSGLLLFLILIACRINEQFLPKAFLLLGASNLLIFSFNALKQAPAIGFVVIGITLWMNKKYVGAIICVVVAILFHESALVAIPILVLLSGAKKRWVRGLEYVVLACFVVAFPVMTRLLSEFVGLFSVELLQEADLYLNESGSVNTNLNLLTVFKGLPYFLITACGLFYRKQLKDKIPHYDKYLVMSVFSSIMIVLSAYMYWMFRFGIYFYFFDFVFVTQLMKHSSNRRTTSYIFYVILLSLLFINFRYLMQYFINYGGF